MNTKLLKNDYRRIYADFFNKYDLILSTPIHFPIVGDTSVFSKGNGGLITQKMTLRNYVGINFSDTEKKIEFIYKNNLPDPFEKGNIENFYPINKDLLVDIGLDCSIGFLSEYNWSDPPSFIANLIVAVLLIKGDITIDDLHRLDFHCPQHKDILDKILKLDKTLIDSKSFFATMRNNSNFLGSCILKSNSHILTIENSGNVEYHNIGPNSDFSQLDLTINILDPNIFIRNNYSPKALAKNEDILKDNLRGWGIGFDNLDIVKGIEYLSIFYSLKTYENLKYLYENDPSGYAFFQDAYSYRKSIRAIFNSMKVKSFDLKNLSKLISEYIQNTNLNTYVDQVGVSGSSRIFVLSSKTGYMSDDFVSKINLETGLNLSLDYSSHFDGFERDGLRLEQYKSKGVYSEFSSHIMVKKFYEKNFEVFSIDDFSVDKFGEGLVLDSINKNIYLEGKSLTSKDILSKTYTIEFFDMLLDNLGKEIHNSLLPISTYSKNKNEIAGKIILPLYKLLKEKLGKSLDIDCVGTIHDFSVFLKTSDIAIYLVKKI